MAIANLVPQIPNLYSLDISGNNMDNETVIKFLKEIN